MAERGFPILRQSLRRLISLLADPVSSRQGVLTVTVLLSSYELLGVPGSDHRRHLHGVKTLIVSLGVDAKSRGLDAASFWIYARQDVAMALINECPNMIAPEDWNTSWANRETEEDILGNHILWLLSMVISVVFSGSDAGWSIVQAAKVSQLSADIDKWFNELPPSFAGVRCGPTSREGILTFGSRCLRQV